MPRVLVIDDQSHVRAAITFALRAKNFEVVAVESGPEGLRVFENSPFDLAIVDIFMPGMDGVKLIKSLRERSPKLPIVAISGVLLRSSARTALDFLPLAPDLTDIICLQKPFRPNELMQAIQKAIAVDA